MTHNSRNQPSESGGNSGRGTTTQNEGKRYDGFDGMNYEQVRQPYHPRQSGNNNREDMSSGNNQNIQQEEL